MTEKEKAKELVDKFTEMMEQTLDVSYPYSAVENIDLAAKKASLIAVDEIIKEVDVWKRFVKENSGHIEGSKYWQQVKKEIEAL